MIDFCDRYFCQFLLLTTLLYQLNFLPTIVYTDLFALNKGVFSSQGTLTHSAHTVAPQRLPAKPLIISDCGPVPSGVSIEVPLSRSYSRGATPALQVKIS